MLVGGNESRFEYWGFMGLLSIGQLLLDSLFWSFGWCIGHPSGASLVVIFSKFSALGKKKSPIEARGDWMKN